MEEHEIVALETEFVDRFGVVDVLEALERIAYEKASHVEANGDASLGRLWTRVGGRIVNAAHAEALGQTCPRGQR